MDADSFGDASEVLLQQEARLAQLAEEKGVLGAENRVLGAAVEALEQKLRAAQRRATEAEARAEAQAHAARRQQTAAAAAAEERQLGLEKHRHRSNNDRILLEQVSRRSKLAERIILVSCWRLAPALLRLPARAVHLPRHPGCPNLRPLRATGRAWPPRG